MPSLGPKATVFTILGKLETVYGTVTSSDVILWEFYHLVQNKNEKCQVFITMLEESPSKTSLDFLI